MCGYSSRAATIRCAASIQINTVRAKPLALSQFASRHMHPCNACNTVIKFSYLRPRPVPLGTGRGREYER